MKPTPQQKTTVYPLSTAEQIVSSTLFFPFTLNAWFNLDLNIRNFQVNFIIQKYVIVIYSPNSNEHIQYF